MTENRPVKNDFGEKILTLSLSKTISFTEQRQRQVSPSLQLPKCGQCGISSS